MSFLKRKRKRSRPSSTSGGDEMPTPFYSTDPRDLPPGFTVGSMSVPYPPPYYKQSKTSAGSHKKKRGKKSKSKKSLPIVESTGWRYLPDVTRLQKSRALDGVVNGKLEGDGSPPPAPPLPLDGVCHPIQDQPAPDQPVVDGICQPIPDPPVLEGGYPVAPIQDGANLPLEQLAEKEMELYDGEEPQHVKRHTDAQVDHGPKTSQMLQVATETESPKQRRRLTLQRSCSMNDLDDLYHHEETPPPKPRKSSEEVESERKPRGISFDDAQAAHGRDVRPFLTHQPRSYQVLSARKASQNRNLVALGCSPDQHKKSQTISKKTLYKPKNAEVLIETIRTGIDVNTLDEITGNAPIHAIVSGKRRSNKVELLLGLLVYGKVKVDLPNRKKMTALHLAVEDGDEMCIRALLAFGANVNAIGRNNYTPLDLAMDKSTIPDIEVALIRMGAETSSHFIRESSPRRGHVPRLYSFAENMKPPPVSEQLRRTADDIHSELANQHAVMEMYRDLEVKVNQKFSLSASYTDSDESPNDTYALVVQQRELNTFNKTLQKSGFGVFSGVEGGSRILFLDGGGIKGLVQLEVLMQLEEATGRKVTDLFDWIVGTSTGGVIALTLVYGKKSLREIFQLYFMMKDRIFSKSKIGFGFNTDVLEEILQEYLDPDIKMTDVTHPKVLISAVKKATTNLELHFFNNCFGDEYMDCPVWKVARYTSATPMFFSECDNYIDGGVICNNPTEYGLTTIQNFFRQQGKKLPIALVVSIGTGVYPALELGSIDLFLGIQTLTRIKQRTQNLISLLGNALVESEMVATNSQSRCREQGIPFYRFSPKLKDVIAGSETDNEKLFNMVIQTRIDTREQGMEELIGLFHTIARASHHLAPSFEENREEREEPAKQEKMARQEENDKKEEANATNLNHQANHFLQLSVPAHSSNTMLSDIEESLEASSKKSYKLRSGSSPSVPARFLVGEEATSVSVTKTTSESEEEVHIHGPDKEETTSSESTTTKSEERSDFDTSSDQSVAEKGSQVFEKVSGDNLVLTQSQESSVFSPELVSSNELPASSPQEDDFGSSLNVVHTRSHALSSEESYSPRLSKESKEVVEKEDDLSNGIEPLASLTPPPSPTLPLVERKESVKEQTNVGQSSASPPTLREFSSQETLKGTDDASSLGPDRSSCSLREDPSFVGVDVSGDEELEEELGEEEVCTDQNQQGQDKDKDEILNSAADGSITVGDGIPRGSSHSLPVTPESPQMNGPHMSNIECGGEPSDVTVTVIQNGHYHVNEDQSPTRDYTTAELHPEIQQDVGLVKGCKAHTQIHKLENTNTQHESEEVPNHYKLNVQLTPDSQQNTNCKFPYRYETEI